MTEEMPRPLAYDFDCPFLKRYTPSLNVKDSLKEIYCMDYEVERWKIIPIAFSCFSYKFN